MLLGRRTLSVMAQQQLDRSAFNQVVRVPAVRVPTKKCQELMRQLRGFTFDLPKTKCIVHDGDRQDVRLLLLNQDLDPTALVPEVRSVLQQHGDFEVCAHDVQLTYSHLSAEAVLKKLLPEGVEVPSSFEGVGHIAHFNLRPEVMPFKHLIGQVVLDKNPSIKTVINKVGQIENEFRVFNMEVLAGEPLLETEVSQHGCRFRLDFSKVYWNSRLEAEHNRLVSSFQPGELVADIMAGIGPFAVPAGLRGCEVFANDLNPESAKYLNLNIQLNRVSHQVTPFNMDGRDFVKLLLATPGGPVEQLPAVAQEAAAAAAAVEPQQQQQQQRQQQQSAQDSLKQEQNQQQQQEGSKAAGRKQQPKRKLVAEVPPSIPLGFRPPPGGVLFQHAVMNLPASAVEFLDAFYGAFDPQAWEGRPLPWVHVYTFQKNETEADVIKRVESALGGPLDEPAQIHSVRDVAPRKIMLCVSFRVPRGVAFADRQAPSSQQQQQQQDEEKVQQQPARQGNGQQQAQGEQQGTPAHEADVTACWDAGREHSQPASKKPKV